MKIKFSELKWVLFISKRFALVDNKGKSALTTWFSIAGIAFGVMTLIVTMSVMNGFQMGYIESILEVNSYHIRAMVGNKYDNDFEEYVRNLDAVSTITPFLEAQALYVGKGGRQRGVMIRAIPRNINEIDKGFVEKLNLVAGDLDFSLNNSVVIGRDLARGLNVTVGDKINLFALSGGSDVDLISDDRILVVEGIFYSGYSEINSMFSFVSLEEGYELLGDNTNHYYGIKITNQQFDGHVIELLKKKNSEYDFESWRSYNRSFFGALQIEKNALMLLVFLIFIVVGVNIFNGMRRMVFERREEICVLSALGGKSKYVQYIFIMQGILIGLGGTIPGLLLGLLLSTKMSSIFVLISRASYNIRLFLNMLFSPEKISEVHRNLIYLNYANNPSRIICNEVLRICVFGILASVIAAWIASRNIQKLSIAEVLRDE